MNPNLETQKRAADIVDVEGFENSMQSLQMKVDAAQEKYDLIKDDSRHAEEAARLKNEIYTLTERLITTKN